MSITRRISFSEFSCYLQCPHKWYLNYHLKLPSGESEELIFGSAIHATIESLFGNSKLKSMMKFNAEETIKTIFKSSLKEELEKIKDVKLLNLFNNKKLASIFMFQALKLIKGLNFYKRFEDYEIADLEIKLDGIELLNEDDILVTFKGFIDLVLKNKKTGRYLIVDWKTSRKVWDIDKKEKDNEYFYAQLMLYKHFYSFVKNIDFELIDTKFYNLPREEPEKQELYNIDITRKMCDDFISFFKNTAKKIALHSISLDNFEKIKFITKKNYCYSCVYNKEELCNDFEQYQIVKSTT